MILKDIFLKNEYPQFFTDKWIKKYLSKLFPLKRIIHTVEKMQALLVLPFLGRLSFEVRSRLQRSFKNYVPYCSLKVIYQFKSRISYLFNFKDVVSTKLVNFKYCLQIYVQLLQRILLWSNSKIFLLESF